MCVCVFYCMRLLFLLLFGGGGGSFVLFSFCICSGSNLSG